MDALPLRDLARSEPGDADRPAVGATGPAEGTAGHRLVLAIQLECVVSAGGAEVGTPPGLGVVAVGAGVGQDLHTAVAYLDGQRVGVSMGSERKEPVGA